MNSVGDQGEEKASVAGVRRLSSPAVLGRGQAEWPPWKPQALIWSAEGSLLGVRAGVTPFLGPHLRPPRYHNLGGLRQQKGIHSRFWRLEVNPRGRRLSVRKTCSSLSFWGPLEILVGPWLVDLSLQSLPCCHMVVSLCVCVFLGTSYKGPSHWI